MPVSTLRCTILVDNTAPETLSAEHGLAIWIEADTRKILWDTGQGSAIFPNARRLGIDLGATEILALSHGHYDHSGGMAEIFGLSPCCRVYAHRAVTMRRYSIREGIARDISMPPTAVEAIEGLDATRRRWIAGDIALFPGAHLSTTIPLGTLCEDSGGPFYADPEGIQPDILPDDTVLWFETPKGLVICTGCCHAGLINTIRHIEKRAPGAPVYAIMGGFHLLNASQERLEATFSLLKELQAVHLIPLHCTGAAVMAMMEAMFPESYRHGQAGFTFSIA